jgi:hypothetical protein
VKHSGFQTISPPKSELPHSVTQLASENRQMFAKNRAWNIAVNARGVGERQQMEKQRDVFRNL